MTPQRAQILSTCAASAEANFMTTPLYPSGWPAGSQVRGDTSPVSGWPNNVWAVNFNNGNVNDNNRNNRRCVRAVRSLGPSSAGEYRGEAPTFRALHAAWQRARRKKQPSANQLRFETFWIDGLLELEQQLQSGTWQPRPAACFIATRPKAREIHAPDFGDRVVHHWLVPLLDAWFEPGFINDSYANRKGKGSHAAVRRLRAFVRQVHSGQGGGWYLQLDVANFFNRIHRATLWQILKRRLIRVGASVAVQRTTHALLRRSAGETGVHYCCTPAERAAVPTHKQLANAPAGCGIPIGNLSSQFFANVYLDRLDQFIKHTLKASRYLRYVDDFVLVHHDRAQLEAWLPAIERFLRDELRLELKAEIKLAPLATGIDFLGYVVYPTYTRVRRRVVAHATAALDSWERDHVDGVQIHATPAQLEHVRAIWRSYEGHFAHAATHRLRARFAHRFPWLPAALQRRRFPIHHQFKAVSITRRRPETKS